MTINNDEYLDCFLDEFGMATDFIAATSAQIEAYRGILPEQLLTYWQELGFSGFANGIFWLTNPADYQDILDRFLDETIFEEDDIYHVIARDAWGRLYLWGQKTGESLQIVTYLNWLKTKAGDEQDIKDNNAGLAIQKFLAFQEIDDLDLENSQGKGVFTPALKKYGTLAANEVYGFSPFLFMGGDKKINNIDKCDIFTHLNLIADMGEMEIIDMASMVGNVIKQYE